MFSAHRMSLVVLSSVVLTGCGAGSDKSPEASLLKSSRITGEWEAVATFHGYADNKAGCDEVAAILNSNSDQMSGVAKSEFKCELK